MNTKIIIGGVDEAFNVPWKRVCLRQPLALENIELEWRDYGGGTGQIMRALNNNEIQAAIVLTEGVVADISKNNQSRIFSSYVKSPLEWGVHVHAASTINSVADIVGKRIAISKFGSGSHLMPVLNAYQQGWSVEDMVFVEVNNLAGGLQALKDSEAEVFFWEKHTTRSYLQHNQLKYVGSFKGPWGAFVLAVNTSLTNNQLLAIEKAFKHVLEEASAFKLSHLSAPYITRFNNMDLPTAQSWLQSTRFAPGISLQENEVQKAYDLMLQCGILNSSENLTAEFFVTTHV